MHWISLRPTGYQRVPTQEPPVDRRGTARMKALELVPPGPTSEAPQAGGASRDGPTGLPESPLAKAQKLLKDDPARFKQEWHLYMRAQRQECELQGQPYNPRHDPVDQYMALHEATHRRARREGLTLSADQIKEQIAAAVALQEGAGGQDTKETKGAQALPGESGVQTTLSDAQLNANWHSAVAALGDKPEHWPVRIGEKAELIATMKDEESTGVQEQTTVLELMKLIQQLHGLYPAPSAHGLPESKAGTPGTDHEGEALYVAPASDTELGQHLVALRRRLKTGLSPAPDVQGELGPDARLFENKAEDYLVRLIKNEGGIDRAGGHGPLETDPGYQAMRVRAVIADFHPDGAAGCVGPFNARMVEQIAQRFSQDHGVITEDGFMEAMRSGRHGNPFAFQATIDAVAAQMLGNDPAAYGGRCAQALLEHESALAAAGLTNASVLARTHPVHDAMSLRVAIADVLATPDAQASHDDIESLARKCQSLPGGHPPGYGIPNGPAFYRLMDASKRQHVVNSMLRSTLELVREKAGAWGAIPFMTAGSVLTGAWALTAGLGVAIVANVLHNRTSPLADCKSALGSLASLPEIAAGELVSYVWGRGLGVSSLLANFLGSGGGKLLAAFADAVYQVRQAPKPSWLAQGPLTDEQRDMVAQLRGERSAVLGWLKGIRPMPPTEGSIADGIVSNADAFGRGYVGALPWTPMRLVADLGAPVGAVALRAMTFMVSEGSDSILPLASTVNGVELDPDTAQARWPASPREVDPGVQLPAVPGEQEVRIDIADGSTRAETGADQDRKEPR